MTKAKLIARIRDLLYDLHAFNQLNDRIVSLISQNFKVDAEGICRKEGIVYWIIKDV